MGKLNYKSKYVYFSECVFISLCMYMISNSI